MSRRKSVITGDSPMGLRYVLYARKSTEDKGSQQRSIDDQIKDCMDMAKRDGLHVVKVIREEKSAKMANNRPQFTKMLEDLTAGKYDGILSWHPDRLSRNSLEAGMIVDMLDNKVIADLKFPTCQFTNDSSGKMLLNILFAISKQYSEHLGEGVIRASSRMFEEGKSVGTPKWGYNRDGVTGLYEPDENFDAIRHAWDMKLNGESNTDILGYLRSQGVVRMTKISRKIKKTRPIVPNKDSIGKMFKDPFYYGVLVQTGKENDLRQTSNFIPMVTEEEYGRVQSIISDSPQQRAGKRKKSRATYYPLRGMVTCGVCGRTMYVGPSQSSNKKNRYLYFRCDNHDCKREQKSVRAKVVFDALFDAVDHLSFDEKQFKLYEAKMSSYTEEKKNELLTEKRSLTAYLRELDNRRQKYIIALSKVDAGSRNHEYIQEQLGELDTKQIEMDDRLRDVQQMLNDSSQKALTKDEFLNLMKTLPEQIRNGSVPQKDALAHLLFLNCVIDAQNKATFLWKEPYNSILETKSFLNGAPD